MAEYMKFSAKDRVHKIPDSVEGYLGHWWPLACAVHTVERAQIKFEDVVVVGDLVPSACSSPGGKAKNPKLLICIDLRTIG